ncbi:hypothetical protein ACLB2K_028751 [Fragaria x ananassa]
MTFSRLVASPPVSSPDGGDGFWNDDDGRFCVVSPSWLQGVQDPVLTVVKMKALSTCAMVLLAVSAFDVYVWSDDDDVAYQSWLPKKPGLTGKAVSGEMVTDGREGILGDLGLKSAKLRLKVWAVGLLSLQLGYFRACLKTISESMSVAKALMVEEEDHGDTYFA